MAITQERLARLLLAASHYKNLLVSLKETAEELNHQEMGSEQKLGILSTQVIMAAMPSEHLGVILQEDALIKANYRTNKRKADWRKSRATQTKPLELVDLVQELKKPRNKTLAEIQQMTEADRQAYLAQSSKMKELWEATQIPTAPTENDEEIIRQMKDSFIPKERPLTKLPELEGLFTSAAAQPPESEALPDE